MTERCDGSMRVIRTLAAAAALLALGACSRGSTGQAQLTNAPLTVSIAGL